MRPKRGILHEKALHKALSWLKNEKHRLKNLFY